MRTVRDYVRRPLSDSAVKRRCQGSNDNLPHTDRQDAGEVADQPRTMPVTEET